MPAGEPDPVHPQLSGAGVDVAAGATFGVGPPRYLARGAEVVVARQPAAVDEHGAMPPGVFAVAADHALGAAIAQVRDEAEIMITSHLHLELVRATGPAVEAIVASGEVAAKRAGHAFTRGSVHAADGDLLALISARFAMLTLAASAGGYVRGDDQPQPPEAARSPSASPPVEDGSPVRRLLELQVADTAPDRLTARLRAHAGLANERLGLHGGVGVLACERTLDLLVREVAGRDDLRPVELRAVFLRPVAADGSQLVCDAELGYLGRSVATTRATLRTPAGKAAVVVDAVHAVDRA